jgi:hypothetical protein
MEDWLMSDDDRLELVEARCDVETVERLRQSYREEGDGLTLIERSEAEQAVDAFRDYIASNLVPKQHVAGFKLIAKVLGEAAANEWGAVERVIADDEAMRRARHAYLNSPPHAIQHDDAARLEHMRAAFRAAFEGQ